MSELIWINGEIQPLADARIGVEDRGFQFADGVYEVIRIYNCKPFALDLHLQRLQKSAAGIQLAVPIEIPALSAEITKSLARATTPEGMIYLQLTRGCAPRNHAFTQTLPTLLFYARVLPRAADDGAKLITVPDERWKRCWIKSIALLPNVLAKNQALAAGADEAVFVDNDLVTECSSSNIFAVIGGRLVTPPVGSKVLPGVTRAILLDLAPKVAVAAEERAFTEEEAQRASELFITSTTREISWVSHWNGRPVGDAACGPITRKLHGALREIVQRQTA
jgi:D-alanine transaminase